MKSHKTIIFFDAETCPKLIFPDNSESKSLKLQGINFPVNNKDWFRKNEDDCYFLKQSFISTKNKTGYGLYQRKKIKINLFSFK